MDPRRLLIPIAAAALVSGCAVFRSPPATASAPVSVMAAAAAASAVAVMDEPAPVAESPADETTSTARPYLDTPPVDPPRGDPALVGRPAIAAANVASRAASTGDGFVGSIQVFSWSPGRVFEVWTAPLRVTTLSLAPGETLVAKAAGDTVRWQIGEVVSGAGTDQRTHVLLKPLQRGLETNLVLTTNRRVYLIDLKSGETDAFNTAVAWDAVTSAAAGPAASPVRVPDPVVMPEGPLDGRYRIEPQGRRPRWTPTSVFNDGRRTFITFDPGMQVDEAPVLFVISPDGEAQLVNYRQVGGLFVVDRVFDRAELRLGDRRPRVVRIRRLAGDGR